MWGRTVLFSFLFFFLHSCFSFLPSFFFIFSFPFFSSFSFPFFSFFFSFYISFYIFFFSFSFPFHFPFSSHSSLLVSSNQLNNYIMKIQCKILMWILSTRAGVSAIMTHKILCRPEKYDIGSQVTICLLRNEIQAFHYAPLQAVVVVDSFMTLAILLLVAPV